MEFMGGSNVAQAFPNYLICFRFIRISTVSKLNFVTVAMLGITRGLNVRYLWKGSFTTIWNFHLYRTF